MELRPLISGFSTLQVNRSAEERTGSVAHQVRPRTMRLIVEISRRVTRNGDLLFPHTRSSNARDIPLRLQNDTSFQVGGLTESDHRATNWTRPQQLDIAKILITCTFSLSELARLTSMHNYTLCAATVRRPRIEQLTFLDPVATLSRGIAGDDGPPIHFRYANYLRYLAAQYPHLSYNVASHHCTTC